MVCSGWRMSGCVSGSFLRFRVKDIVYGCQTKRLLVRPASFLMMSDPLAVLEAPLGSVDSWPSYVLGYMFLLQPNSHVTKKVAAYMYGNVRGSEAVACYNACNGLHRRRLQTMLNAWYFVWDRDEYQRHKDNTTI